MSWRPIWTPLACLLLALLWTWPAAVSPHLLGHHPDAAGTAWFVSAAPRLVDDLHDPLSGHPGATYGRPDSFVLLALTALPWPLPPARGLAWLAIAGVALSAWAAEAFARALGARAPWSLLAGLAYATSGLAATAWLEGYVYHLVNPWLPLLAWSWWRATRPGGTALHGASAGAAFLGCLLTSAWFGFAATILVLGFLAGALWRHRAQTPWRPALAAAGVVAPAAALYVQAFVVGGADGAAELANAGNPTGRLFVALLRLLPPLPSVDVTGNAQSAALPVVTLALLGAAPLVLRGVPGWRTVACTGLGALLFSLVPHVLVGGTRGLLPERWATSLDVVLASLLRFPERLGWTFLVCAGAVAARVASDLADRLPRAPWPLLGLALLDATLLGRMPGRQRAAPAQVPSAYAGASGPVLDLWPEDLGRAPSWTLWTTNLGCYYQTAHGRPIADLCVASPGRESPREALGRTALDGLLRGDAPAVAQVLAAEGYATLALHPDVFERPDRARLLTALAQIDPAPARSTDGGELVLAYALAPRDQP